MNDYPHPENSNIPLSPFGYHITSFTGGIAFTNAVDIKYFGGLFSGKNDWSDSKIDKDNIIIRKDIVEHDKEAPLARKI